MAWFGHDPTPGEIAAAAKRKAEDRINAENRRLKEQKATGYRCVTEMPRH